MIFNKRNLEQFVKTKLAQEMQKAQIGNFLKKKGAPPIVTTVKKAKPGEKPKASAGIDMGNQVEPGVIPVVYGHTGISNTQFDLGQKPSDLDAKVVTQEIKIPLSEGQIGGLSWRSTSSGARDTDNERWITGYSKYFPGSSTDDTPENLKQVIINDDWVIDPTNSVANFKDVSVELTYGDNTTDTQTGEITDYNPILFEEEDDIKVDAIDDPIKEAQNKLNDLADVTASPGSRHVVYWNAEANEWQAKPFNDLLNETGATYDGGAGGAGGSGGSGGIGGTGGFGGIGAGTGLIKYTQWNPPPARIEVRNGEVEYTHTVTEPTRPAQTVVSGKGAPLFRYDEETPIFTTNIDFADVDESIDHIAVNIHFPDGIYKEIKTVATTKNGEIEECGTQRPLENSGDLECLTPVIAVAPDGKTSTTKTRTTGEVQVYVALTTQLCGREFILHEYNFPVSKLSNNPYTHREEIALVDMNAGSTHIGIGSNSGYAQIGPLDGVEETATCDPNKPQQYDYQTWILRDYLAAYPNDIVKAANEVKVYAWIQDKLDATLNDTFYEKQYSISTNAYLKGVDVCKPIDDYEHWYAKGGLISTNYRLYGPNHNWAWRGRKYETYSDPYYLGKNRCYEDVIDGDWGDDLSPTPLVVEDGTTLGSAGESGSAGATGATGSAGASGTQGSVTVPTAPGIPFVDGNDGSYSGDGNADTVTLPKVTVTNADTTVINTLTITVSGSVGATVDVTSVTSGVTRTGGGTANMTLSGNISDLQDTLDTGLKFFSTTGTRGDIKIDLEIETNEGSSKDTITVRPEAVTSHTSPIFEFYISGTSGNIQAEIKGRPIMEQISASGTIEEIAETVAGAITGYTSKPNWQASSDGNKVTGVGEAGIGDSLNGAFVENGASTPLAATTLDLASSVVKQGVAPSKITQPKQKTNNLKSNFVKADSYSNPLNADDIAWLKVRYRPEQEDGATQLSEIGVTINGIHIQEFDAIDFLDWYNAGYTATPGYSSNGAVVFFDYLTNTRYGLGNDIILDADQKLDLYYDIWVAAQWAFLKPTNQDNAYTGLFNGVFYGAESKYEALQKIADSFYGKFVYLNGNPRLFFDGQSYSWTRGNYTHTPTIKKLVNQSNAGDMIYQGGSIDNIFNVINVKWNNPDNYFRMEELQYKNNASITKYGERETTLELTGCTSKQQALWHGAWYYETEAVNSETVTYIAGFDHYDVLPGDLIYIADTLRPDVSTIGGRVSAVNGTTLTLDRNAGTGSIAVVDDTGVVQTGTVSGTTATMSSGTYQKDAVFNVYSGTLQANYRVVAIEESEDGIYAVTAQKHDPDKYTRIWANTV